MNYRLGELTWDEAKDRIATADYILLPTGSIEQHSVHLPLLTDSIRAEEISGDLLKAANENGLTMLGLPTLCYGCSDHHLDFPGTISLDFDFYIKVLIDIGRSLTKHRARRLLVLNFHGGNKEPIILSGNKIQRELNLDFHMIHWTGLARSRIVEWAGSEEWGHAGEYETSMILHLRPDLVRKNKIQKQVAMERPRTKLVRSYKDYYQLGGKGDPTKASAEFAAGLIEQVNLEIVEILKNDLTMTRKI